MQEQITLTPVDSVRITSMVDNIIDIFLPDQGPAQRNAFASAHRSRRPGRLAEGGEVGQQLVAEHGFSALVDFAIGDREHRMLFDTGVSPDGLVENMRLLGIAPDSVETVVLSHGHFDHTTGLDGLARKLGRVNLPVVIHPEFWSRRRIRLPGQEVWELPSTSKRALEDVGFCVIEERMPSFLFHDSLLVTGEIDRETDFEVGFPIQDAMHHGAWEPDPLVLDDQALVLHVAGKGLVVVTGCGHAGVINTIHHAQRLTGVEQLYAVFGGFHLSGPLFEPLIPRVCAAFAELRPELLVPSHCTGWKAMDVMESEFPDAFIPNSVGSVYRL